MNSSKNKLNSEIIFIYMLNPNARRVFSKAKVVLLGGDSIIRPHCIE